MSRAPASRTACASQRHRAEQIARMASAMPSAAVAAAIAMGVRAAQHR